MAAKTGMFSGLKAAKASIRATYERPGHYIQMIRGVKAGKNRNKEDFLAIEKVVVAAVEGTHTPGEDVTHLMMPKHDSFLANVKAFIENVLEINDSDYSAEELEEAMEDICGDSNPMAGTFIEVVNHDIMTKADKPFTIVSYKREVPASEIKELLAEGDIDAAKFYQKVIPEKDFNVLLKDEAGD